MCSLGTRLIPARSKRVGSYPREYFTMFQRTYEKRLEMAGEKANMFGQLYYPAGHGSLDLVGYVADLYGGPVSEHAAYNLGGHEISERLVEKGAQLMSIDHNGKFYKGQFVYVKDNGYYQYKQCFIHCGENMLKIMSAPGHNDGLDEILDIVKTYIDKKPKGIGILGMKYGEMTVKQMPLTDVFEPDYVQTNYPDDFSAVNEAIIKALDVNNKGILMFHGDPGTGKTSYIRYLAVNSPSSFLIIPKPLLGAISSAEFTEVIARYSDLTIVLEDAEECVSTRDGSNNSIVGSILNLADGILSGEVKTRVILTFNCPMDDVDPALLRPGRLIANYDFCKLDGVKADAIRVKRGKEPTGEPATLAELYCDPAITVEHMVKHVGFSTK